MKIEGNDLFNGKIYFKKSSLTLDEDNNPTGKIFSLIIHVTSAVKISSLALSFGTLLILWRRKITTFTSIEN